MSSVHSLDASPNPTICFYHEKFGEEATKCKGDWCDFFKKSDSKKKSKKNHGLVSKDEFLTHPFAFCCAFCGGEKSCVKSLCPARDETCSKCLKTGHFGNVCLSAGSGKKQLPDLRTHLKPDLRTHLKNNQGERQPGDLRERLNRQRNRENLDSEDPIERSPMARGRSPTSLYYDNAVDQAEIAETTIDKVSDRNLKKRSNRVKNNNDVLASSQKYCLSDIFYDRCRPSWAQTNSESQKVYIIPRT